MTSSTLAEAIRAYNITVCPRGAPKLLVSIGGAVDVSWSVDTIRIGERVAKRELLAKQPKNAVQRVHDGTYTVETMHDSEEHCRRCVRVDCTNQLSRPGPSFDLRHSVIFANQILNSSILSFTKNN